jgi:aminoglycoside phosphotransferase family enzyme
VTREADGSLALGGEGTPLDWLVEMTRFDQHALFDRLAAEDRLNLTLMRDLAAAIARLHACARIRSDHGGRAGMSWVADGNALALLEQGLDSGICARLAAETQAAIVAHAARLDIRRRGGLVRECHGDLHLRNICLLNGVPTLFDGVEFNDEIVHRRGVVRPRVVLMDLWRRRLWAHANVVLNEYLACTPTSTRCASAGCSSRAARRFAAKTSVTTARSQTDRRAEPNWKPLPGIISGWRCASCIRRRLA